MFIILSFRTKTMNRLRKKKIPFKIVTTILFRTILSRSANHIVIHSLGSPLRQYLFSDFFDTLYGVSWKKKIYQPKFDTRVRTSRYYGLSPRSHYCTQAGRDIGINGIIREYLPRFRYYKSVLFLGHVNIFFTTILHGLYVYILLIFARSHNRLK